MTNPEEKDKDELEQKLGHNDMVDAFLLGGWEWFRVTKPDATKRLMRYRPGYAERNAEYNREQEER